MNIHEHTALLDAFVDGQLTAEEMTEVQAHLAECPDCRAYVDDALTIRASFPTEEEPALPEGFAGRVMQAVAKAPQSRPKKQPWGRLAAAAACLALVILVQHGVETSSLSGSTDTAAYAADCETEESTAPRSAETPSAAAADSCRAMGRQSSSSAPQRVRRAMFFSLSARTSSCSCPSRTGSHGLCRSSISHRAGAKATARKSISHPAEKPPHTIFR